MNILIDSNTPFIYETPCAFIAIYESDKHQISVDLSCCHVKVTRPLNMNINAQNGFVLSCPSKTVVEFDEGKPLFIFTYEKEKVNPQDYTYYFSSGTHTPDNIVLKSNESIYVECGAVVKTHICAENAKNIKICGRGIIDTAEIGAKKHRMIKLTKCEKIEISDVSLIGAIDWCIVTIASQNIDISRVNIITWEVNGDGVDIVASRNVNIDGCFAYTADDCITLKATAYDDTCGCANIDNVRVSRCIFWNTRPGNVMEIGFETRCDEISNVIFDDCDVLHCEYEGWQSGGVFTIHNGDRAEVHDIIYRNIRVEDASQKLFDMKSFSSHYSVDTIRGHIYNITIENIDVLCEYLPPSIFRGCDNDHGVKNVRVHNLCHKGRQVNSLLEAHIIAESGSEIIFE